MKNILVATDFSPHSQDVLKQILDELQDTKIPSRILLINTYLVDPGAGPENILALNDELKSESKKKLESQRLEALKWISNPNVTIETGSHMGSLDNVIKNLQQTQTFDYVAMGKK